MQLKQVRVNSTFTSRSFFSVKHRFFVSLSTVPSLPRQVIKLFPADLLVRRVASVESVNNDRRKDILKGIRKFRNFTYSSTALMYLLVLIVLAVYVERLPLPAVRLTMCLVVFVEAGPF